MQTCPECGGRNEDGELFCGACGTYLEWEETAPERVGVAPGEGAAQDPAPAGRGAATDERGDADHPDGSDGSDGAGATGGGALPGALGRLGHARATRALRETADRTTGGAVTRATSTASRARSQTTRVRPGAATGAVGAPAAAAAGAQTGGSPRRPAPRRPEAGPVPAPRRPVPETTEEPPPQPGELVCGACGIGNAPHRNFCRRCGASLADAPVQQQRSWWRRLLRPERRSGPKAGTRPRARRRRRFPTGVVVLLVVLGLLGGAAWYFRDTLATAYAATLDRIVGDDPYIPSQVSASSELADRPAGQATDGIIDRAWSPDGAGPGEWVEFTFDQPFRLVSMLVTAGAGPAEEQRLLEARPAELRLTLTTTQGELVEDVTLTDSGGPQRVDVAAGGVESVRVTVQSVYGAELAAPMALAEVEFRGRG